MKNCDQVQVILKVLLIDSNQKRLNQMDNFLSQNGLRLKAFDYIPTISEVKSFGANLITYFTNKSEKSLIDLETMQGDFPGVSILVVTQENSKEAIDALLDRGALNVILNNGKGSEVLFGVISSYKFDARIKKLETQIECVENKYNDLKIIGHAKRILMKRYKETEAEAHYRLQKMSMNMNKTIREISEQIIDASALLG